MDIFPVELWSRILNFITKNDLTSVSKVCALLRILARPILYEEVDFTLHTHRAVDPFVRSITEQPTLSLLVRGLRLVPPGSGKWAPLWAPQAGCDSSHPVLANIASFSKLRSLDLSGFHIDTQLRDALRSLPCLAFLRLTTCVCDLESVPDDDEQTTWSNHSLDLRVTIPVLQKGWYHLMPATLRSLHLATPHTQTILSDVIRSPQCDTANLTTLSILSKFPNNLLTFLMSCPQVRRISLPKTLVWSEHTGRPRSLPQDVIPFLEEYTGCAANMEIFIEGRPVHTVTVWISLANDTSSAVNSDILRLLQLSSIPVGTLRLEGTYTLEVLRHIPASIRSLAWSEWQEESLSQIMMRLTVLSRLSSLWVLRWMSLDDHHADLVHAASGMCTSLEQIVFEGDRYTQWKNEAWHRRKDGAWTAETSRPTDEYTPR